MLGKKIHVVSFCWQGWSGRYFCFCSMKWNTILPLIYVRNKDNSEKTYVVTPHWNRLNETVLVMAHKISFVFIYIPITPSYLEH